MAQRLPRVTVITTGGTIASRVDPATGAATPVVSGAELVAMLPGIERIAEVTVREHSLIPSWDLTPAFMLGLTTAVGEARAAGAGGVVITQGTDTLEETAYWLDLTVDATHAPVVVTGAMRNNSEIGSDGPRNLFDAIAVAARGAADFPAPVVVANSQIHSARDVVKSDSFNPATFQSPATGPVGFVLGGEVRSVRRHAARRGRLPVERAEARVHLIRWAAGMDDLLLRACLAAGVDGVVIEGFGLGHIPGGCVPAVAALRERGIPVVLTTRCSTGPTLPVYGGAGGGRDLLELGVVFAQHLSGVKARLLLIAALGSPITRDDVASAFTDA